MRESLLAFLSFAVAGIATGLAVPVIRTFAHRWKLLDYPDGQRHRHETPVPRLGGVAVCFGVLVALSLASLQAGFSNATPWASPLNRSLVVACAILFVIGLLDDLRGVRPVVKLLGQSAAAAIVIAFGFRIDVVSVIPGSEFSLGVFSVPISLLWLVGVSNAFNLIDGLDGLAGGVGMIALLAICASAAALGSGNIPLQSLALAGALVGFLRHNRPPARIFLGDSGSLVIGFLLAILSVRGATTQSGVLYAIVPIFALSYLLLDTGIAMMRRWLRGAPLSRADGRHIHHQLLALGLPPKRAVAVIYVQSAFIAVLGLCVTFVPPQMTLAIAGIGIAILLVIFVYGVRWLDYHEFLEAGASFASGVRKSRTSIQDRILARDIASMLRAAASLAQVNEIVSGYSSAFRFVHMEVLFENAPAAGTVRAPDHIGSATWLVEYPVFATSGPRTHAEPVLAIWCAVSNQGNAANAERVAQILVPAIATALQKNPSASTDGAHEARSWARSAANQHPKRRISQEHRRISDAFPSS